MAKLSPYLVLRARAEALALLWQAGEYELADIFRALRAYADDRGIAEEIGKQARDEIISAPFKKLLV